MGCDMVRLIGFLFVACLNVSAPVMAAVDQQGLMISSGAGKIGLVADQVVPPGWQPLFASPVADLDLTWSSNEDWTFVLNRFAKQKNVYVLADGVTKQVVFASPQHGESGFTLFNSQSPAAGDYPWSSLITMANTSSAGYVSAAKKAAVVASPAIVAPKGAGVVSSPASNASSPFLASSTTTPASSVTPTNTKLSLPEPLPAKQPLTVTSTDSSSSEVKIKSEVVATTVTPAIPYASAESEQLQAKLSSPDRPYLTINKTANSRMYARDGKLFFHVQRGPLEDNVRALFAQTENTMLLYKISPVHSMPNDFWLSGTGALGILDQMLTPFETPKRPVWRAYINNIVLIKYDGTPDSGLE